MTTNDMDRYYWKTGQRWSSDNRPVNHIRNPLRYPPLRIRRWRPILWVFLAYVISMAFSALSRIH